MNYINLPNFLIIGAPRAGTTTLHRHLSEHPHIYMSDKKEPNFFALDGETFNFIGPASQEIKKNSVFSLEAYKSLFTDASNFTAVGEASTQYLYFPKTPDNIYKFAPKMKLIAVLRNPIERAYSSYLHLVSEGSEPAETFEIALAEESSRIQNRWWPQYYYKEKGFYYRQLVPYFERFNESQIKILFYDDLNSNPSKLFEEVCDFISVDPDLLVKAKKAPIINNAGVPKNSRLHKFITQPHVLKGLLKRYLPDYAITKAIGRIQSWNLEKPILSRHTADFLRDSYGDDVTKLQSLTKRDLSSWM